MTNVTTTGQCAQTPAQAYKTAFDALRVALDAVVQETMENPSERPFSSDSYLPEHMLEQAQKALQLAANLREPTPVKAQKTVKTVDPRCQYWTETRTVRGAWVDADFFDTPPARCSAESHVESAIMRAVMAAAAAGDSFLVRSVLCSAGEKLTSSKSGPTQYWAALGFLGLVADLLCPAAKALQWDDWLSRKQQADAESHQRMEQYYADRRKEIALKAATTRKARREGVTA